MSYPFPGMNPWLEQRGLWKSVHSRLITAIADTLAPALEPRYFVDVELHTYISTFPASSPASRYPDVTILDRGGMAVAVTPSADTATPLVIDLPLGDTVEEPFLEVRLLPSGEVVTVIELLSHTNKQGGRDRASYEQKRQTFLDANVNFVEIDLLRAHRPMPFMEQAEGRDYRIFVRRREQLAQGLLYAFDIRDEIPRFEIPLQPDDEEPVLDLGQLLKDLYERARYRLIIDYEKPASPEIDDETAQWANLLWQSLGN